MKPALIIVDIQNDYFEEGKKVLEGSLEAARQAKRLLETFRSQNLPVIFIQHIAIRAGATFLLPNTSGIEIHDLVKPLAGETIYQKHFPNSFRKTPLFEHLQHLHITELIIAGMMTHMCVDATTRAAFDFGYECIVAHNACATRAIKFKDLTIPAEYVHGAFMAALGSTYAKILSVDEIITHLA